MSSRSALFDEVIRENEEDLLRYFQRRLINSADAAEAFGELLLTAWKISRKMPADRVEARMWLFGVAHKVLLTARRTLVRRSAALERFVDEMSLVEQSPPDDSSFEIRDAIDRLADEDKELVRLVYWDGLRSHEAAAALGINPSTARSRLSRAKQHLRAALEAPDPELIRSRGLD